MSTTHTDNSSSNNSQVEELEEVDQLELQWKNMELSLSTFKIQVTALQQQLRSLEKATRRQVKQLKKEAFKTKNRGNRAPSGFAKPSKISKELCSFMGKEEGAEVARTEVTKFVIAYIKENSLAESKDIKPDEKLADLLGLNEEDNVTYFNIQKYMNKHFTKVSKKTSDATV